ncbi:MAG: VCBS repeat-containing protein [Proteobacteria bacterium]|nr:VCBS repeat-containing protein [Pseudomonadota bacterium]
MPRLSLRFLAPALAVLLSVFSVAVFAAAPPTLFTVNAGAPTVLAQGAQKSWPIKVSETSAFDAVFQGGMWLPNPAGGQIYARYQRHILHSNGTWTWVGTVDTVHGEQPVVLTFGKGGVFGLVPQASGYPLRIVSNAKGTQVVATSATAMAQSAEALRLHSAPDYVIPPRANSKVGGLASVAPGVGAAAPATHSAAAAGGPTIISVMVAYTSGYISQIGSQNLALTRIQNLVDITNQAYIASGVNVQIQLVYSLRVNYPDNTSNQSALDDLTGLDTNGNPVSVPVSLRNIASLRVKYGADLVALVRSYQNATQGNCGIGWLVGGDETPIVPNQSNAYGYSVVSDGSNGGYYCLDTTFAHELGHNMGSAHDRANASNPGAYPYSYGYVGNGTNGFSTIMAYGTTTTTPLAVFSNPNISTCQNTPCGVPDSNTSSSADNAHSLNNTAPLIAQFEPPATVTPPAQISAYVRNDVNGDGKSDLLWMNKGINAFGYWLMSGAQSISAWTTTVAAGYQVVATGDFTGNGWTDIVWQGPTGNLYMWIGNGSTFTNKSIGNVPAGASVVGAGDVNGDGMSDLLFLNSKTGAFTYWLMNGANITSQSTQQVAPGYTIAAIGDFTGDGMADLVWTSANNDLYMWISTGYGFASSYVGTYPAGWQLIGAGDITGSGTDDLLWRNQGAGLFGYWLMNGATVTGLQTFPAASNYSVAAIGDFNGDGRIDVMWTSSANDLYLWNSTGVGFNGHYVGTYPAGWSIIPSQLMAAGNP